MNLTSFLAKKCFEFLLSCGTEKEKGQGQAVSSPLTPLPWAVEDEKFRARCNGCGLCIANCEKGVLVMGKEGFPRIDFATGSCSFCGACAESCSEGLFLDPGSERPWNLRAKINRNCIALNNVLCGTCIESCPEGAIVMPKANGSFGTPMIRGERCNGCGACFNPCPVRAIEIIPRDKEGT